MIRHEQSGSVFTCEGTNGCTPGVVGALTGIPCLPLMAGALDRVGRRRLHPDPGRAVLANHVAGRPGRRGDPGRAARHDDDTRTCGATLRPRRSLTYPASLGEPEPGSVAQDLGSARAPPQRGNWHCAPSRVENFPRGSWIVSDLGLTSSPTQRQARLLLDHGVRRRQRFTHKLTATNGC